MKTKKELPAWKIAANEEKKKQRFNKWYKKRAVKRAIEGLCYRCGVNLNGGSYSNCPDCLAYYREKMRIKNAQINSKSRK